MPRKKNEIIDNVADSKEESKKELSILSENTVVSDNIKNISKGELLEYQIKRLFFYMGYYTKNNIIVQTSQDDPYDIVTDLDVYGIYIHNDFSMKTIWADCKSGDAQELNRISWLIGVKDMIKVDEILFVKKGTKRSTKIFANSRGINIVDLSILSQMEKKYEIVPNDWSNPWNPNIQMHNSKCFKEIKVPDNAKYKKISKYITTNFWAISDCYTRVKKTITALRELSSSVQLPLNKKEITSIKWAIYQLVGMLTLSTFQVCRESCYLNDNDKRDMIIQGLIYGSNSKQKIDEIMLVTNRIAKKTLLMNNIDEKVSLGVPEIRLYPPDYTEAFIDLVFRITNKPLCFYDILRYLDFVLFEYDLVDKVYDENKITIDGGTEAVFAEDVQKRYEAYGWQVLRGSMYNMEEIAKLVESAKADERPSLIILKSAIGKGAPTVEGKSAAHGAPIGEEGVAEAKKNLGLNPEESFFVAKEAYDYFAAKESEFAAKEAEWNKVFAAW